MKTFEEKLARLEELSARIKERDISLDEAVNCFDEGIKLARLLEKELKKIEKKVEILVNEPDADQGIKPELSLFDGEAED
jgi:exodeoxyribonuclease VII small subunit